MASFAIWMSAALAAVSVAASLTQPDENATGVAIAAAPSPETTVPPAPEPPPTTAAPPPPPTTTSLVLAPPTTGAPRVVAPPVPTTARVVASTGTRESCGWSWDATHLDDGSVNEVTLNLDAPRRPNALVTITAKPGASLPKVIATSTDVNGQASALVALSNDKRDWTLTIGAAFLGSSCDTRTFTISY